MGIFFDFRKFLFTPSSGPPAIITVPEESNFWTLILGYLLIIFLLFLCFFGLYAQKGFRQLSAFENKVVGVVVFLYICWKVHVHTAKHLGNFFFFLLLIHVIGDLPHVLGTVGVPDVLWMVDL